MLADPWGTILLENTVVHGARLMDCLRDLRSSIAGGGEGQCHWDGAAAWRRRKMAYSRALGSSNKLPSPAWG
jgi:hypothetical protein